MKTISIKINNELILINKIITGILINQLLFINQMFLNLIHEMNKHANQNKLSLQVKIQHHIKKLSNQKILKMHKATNQIKFKMKSHYHIFFNNMKLQKHNLLFFQKSNAAESLRMTMNPYLRRESSKSSSKPLRVFTRADPVLGRRLFECTHG